MDRWHSQAVGDEGKGCSSPCGDAKVPPDLTWDSPVQQQPPRAKARSVTSSRSPLTQRNPGSPADPIAPQPCFAHQTSHGVYGVHTTAGEGLCMFSSVSETQRKRFVRLGGTRGPFSHLYLEVRAELERNRYQSNG